MTKTFCKHVCGILRAFNIEEFYLLISDKLVDAFVSDINMLIAMFHHRI